MGDDHDEDRCAGEMMPPENIDIARAAFAALDGHDVEAFLALCDREVELFRFTASTTGESIGPEAAVVPLCGREEIERWFRGVFDTFPAMRVTLGAVDEVGDSVVCDTQFALRDDYVLQWSFVLTMRKGRLLGFEVFHPQVDGGKDAGRHRLTFGQFRVRGKAGEITPPRPCAWVFYQDEEGIPYSSIRVYPDQRAALAAIELRL